VLLKKLVFDNYKTYYGHQVIDFFIPKDERESNGKNIILVGGLNGAGKTTILKAILYVLFGKRGMSEIEHKKLFSNVINNTFFEEGGLECSLTLILETDSGEEWTLKVKWFFNKNKSVSHEERNLEVKKAESSLSKRARIDNIETYNKFIDRIIPYHAAPFFIFDGEEIKEIILRQNSNEMEEAIHKITGMEAYNQLLTDLKYYKNSIESKVAKSISSSKLNNIQKDLEKLEQEVGDLEARRDKYITDIRKYQDLIKIAKEARNIKLTQNLKSREVIIKQQSRVSTELEIKQEELNMYLKQNSVNIILGKKIPSLKRRLKQEYEITHKRILQNASLTPYRNFINQLLNQSIEPELTNDQVLQIQKIGEEIWIRENSIQKSIPFELNEIHDISNNDFNFLVNIPIKDKIQSTNYINEIEKLQLKLNALEVEIRNAPESVDIDDENNKIDLLTKKLGEIDLRYKTNNKKLSIKMDEKINLKNHSTRLNGQEGSMEDLQKSRDDISKTIIMMEQYVADVTLMKATLIKEEFSKMLKQLFRKQEEFGRIEFDINTYSIRLYNDKMQEISVEDRSAGEMQMISSALIWALTKASDLSLPIVIDTPLGRLDSYHRNHLINHYYKELSDQVIILSTDTEITKDYINVMEKHSYKQYMLDYNEDKKYTVIRDGYFDFIKG